MSTSSTSSSTIFSGTSRFSTDLQSVIAKAVSFATLPITQMSQEKTKLQDQSDALTSLQSTFTTLSSSLSSLATATTKSAVTAVSSDYTIASPTSSSSGQTGTYKLNITDIGSYSTALSSSSLPTVSDPSSSGLTTSSAVTLTVDGTETTLTPASSSLNDLVTAINGANAGVQATVVNLGSSSSPSYRLSLESTKLGAVNIGLSDGTTSMVDTQTTGTNAKYTVNGYPTDGISTDSREVVVAPGLSVDLVATGSATVTVSSSTNALSSALQTFITNYNSAVDALDAQRGQSGGALVGDSTVTTLSTSLRHIASYGLNGYSLTDLGVTFDKTGKLQLDSTVLSGLSATDVQKATTFLGSSTTSGFLKYATDEMTGLTSTDSGVIQNSINVIKDSITNEESQIEAAQTRVTNLQTRLTDQMNQADALIANLEQKYTYYSQLFQSYLDSQNSSTSGS